MRQFLQLSVSILLMFMFSCGGGNSLHIKGDNEAVILAEGMILELGGKKNWTNLKSVYIRTVSLDMVSGQPFAFEEWINLDEPKFMNHRIINDVHYFQIVDGNDGWLVQNNTVTLLQPDNVTNYLEWYDRFFMRNIKLLAFGGENVEVKVNGEDAFDVFVNSSFIAGFSLNEKNLPVKYVTPGTSQRFNIMNVDEWGEYKGYKYPLKVTGENIRAHYQTDYWDAGTMDAESSFNVSFDPYKIAERFE
ncbi:MAG: hypothetical protein PVH48_08730 [Cyclobacteriaceae bacterium]